MSVFAVVCVFVGGGLGACLRYFAQVFFYHESLFPWTTLGINIAGSFFIGIVWAVSAQADWFLEWGRYFIVIGLLGGFTTFSTFSYETLLLLQTGRMAAAFAYALGSVAICLGAVFAGFRLIQLS